MKSDKYICNLIKGLPSKLLMSFLPAGTNNPVLVKRAANRCRGYLTLWKETMKKIDDKLGDFSPNFPRETDKIAVIVEPRRHPDMLSVLRSYAYFLGPEWGIQIFHGTENEEWLRTMLASWKGVRYTNLGKANLSVPDYSRLLKSEIFWSRIEAEHVLIFQTDSIMLRKGIDQFLGYNYIGAPWKVSKEHTLSVGNGGLSLRHKSAMLRVIREHPDQSGHAEDLYFSKYLIQEVPDRQTAMKFSVETIPYKTPIGVHKPLRISLTELKEIMNPVF